MVLLWIDIDQDNLTLDQVKQKLINIGIGSAIIYSSSSSMLPNDKGVSGRRWRVLIELKNPIECRLWLDIQEALAELMGGDSSATRIQQILFAPNRPPESLHYEHAVLQGDLFGKPPLLIQQTIDALRAERKRIHEITAAALTIRPSAKDGFNIQTINDSMDISTLLEKYQYKRKGRKWISPNSSSGTPGVVAFNSGRWFSHHESDRGIGLVCDGGVCGDCFDLYTHYEHGGDYKTSLASLVCLLDPEANKKRQFDFVKNGGGS